MDYDQLREVLVNTEKLYSLWQSTGQAEETFIRANASLIEEHERNRLKAEKTKARQNRFLEKRRQEGRKHLGCMVSAETFEILCRHRDKAIRAGEKKNLGQIIDELINVQRNVKLNVSSNVTSNKDKPADTGPIENQEGLFHESVSDESPDLPEILANIDPNNTSIDYRHKVILTLRSHYPEKNQAKTRVEFLNDNKFFLDGEPWDSRKHANQQVRSAKWAEKTGYKP